MGFFVKNKNAFAGSRTRVYCLEGNYPNRWTTNAVAGVYKLQFYKDFVISVVGVCT